MTPETLKIDRIFRGVGRLSRATGTTIPAMRRNIDRMLTTLFERGRLDVLRAIRDGHVSCMQAYEAMQRSALHELPVGDTLPLLREAMLAWIDAVAPEYSPEHAESLETSRRYFEKHDPEARVADLPRVLEQLRASLGAKHPRSFNLARAAALAFVRAMLKKSHPLYIACTAVDPRPQPKAAPRRAITPDQMRTWFPAPESDVVDAIAWSTVTTGMGAKELWGAWETHRDRIHIGGTKREGRVRDIPLVRAPAVPQLSRDRFEKLFRARMKPHGVTPYDLRRTYVRWLESAGVPRTRRKMYLGHGAQDVTDLYERHEIETFLAEDAKRLATFMAKKQASHAKRHATRQSRAG